jgi:hypothetical protein
MNLCWRKSTGEREGKQEQKLDAALKMENYVRVYEKY